MPNYLKEPQLYMTGVVAAFGNKPQWLPKVFWWLMATLALWKTQGFCAEAFLQLLKREVWGCLPFQNLLLSES